MPERSDRCPVPGLASPRRPPACKARSGRIPICGITEGRTVDAAMALSMRVRSEPTHDRREWHAGGDDTETACHFGFVLTQGEIRPKRPCDKVQQFSPETWFLLAVAALAIALSIGCAATCLWPRSGLGNGSIYRLIRQLALIQTGGKRTRRAWLDGSG